MKNFIVSLIQVIVIFGMLFGFFIYLAFNDVPEPLGYYSIYIVLPVGLWLAYTGIKEELKK